MATVQKNSLTGTIIILNYQTDSLVLHLVAKLKRVVGWHIIVVDNSPQNTLKNKLPESVEYIVTGKNLGYAGGNNVGIKEMKGEWCFIVNSDIEMNEKQITSLVEIANKHHASVVAPQLLNVDGSPQYSAGYFDSFATHPLNAILARPRFIDPTTVDKPIYVDVATGAALLIQQEVFDTVGMFDDLNFFMYFEDMDFCQRLKAAGIPILYVPQSKITHYGGASSNQDIRSKNLNYQKGLSNYIKKHRGIIIEKINRALKLFT